MEDLTKVDDCADNQRQYEEPWNQNENKRQTWDAMKTKDKHVNATNKWQSPKKFFQGYLFIRKRATRCIPYSAMSSLKSDENLEH